MRHCDTPGMDVRTVKGASGREDRAGAAEPADRALWVLSLALDPTQNGRNNSHGVRPGDSGALLSGRLAQAKNGRATATGGKLWNEEEEQP